VCVCVCVPMCVHTRTLACVYIFMLVQTTQHRQQSHLCAGPPGLHLPLRASAFVIHPPSLQQLAARHPPTCRRSLSASAFVRALLLSADADCTAACSRAFSSCMAGRSDLSSGWVLGWAAHSVGQRGRGCAHSCSRAGVLCANSPVALWALNRRLQEPLHCSGHEQAPHTASSPSQLCSPLPTSLCWPAGAMPIPRRPPRTAPSLPHLQHCDGPVGRAQPRLELIL